VRRVYAGRAFDGSAGVFVRADRGGDRLIARGMSERNASKVARLLNDDDQPSIERCAEDVARAFHEEYERLAPDYGWATQQVSRVDWDDLPENQRALMVHVVSNVLPGRY
jgi:hypothetical protein